MKFFSCKSVIFAFAGLLAFPAVADLHMESSDKENAGLSFHANFDYSMRAQRASGNAKFKIFGPGKSRFAPGCMNQGLRIGVDKNKKQFYADIEAAKNIDTAQGTISFWVKPENWDGNSHGFAMFVSGTHQDGSTFYIYKYDAKRMGLCTVVNKKSTSKWYNPQSWKAGEWHHIAVVWGKDYQRTFVDGKAAVTQQRSLSTAPINSLKLGTRGWGGDKGTSIIDELKIFNRPLNADEIAKEFSRFGKALEKKNVMKITAGKTPVKVDGVIGKDEYGFAATGMLNIPDNPAVEQTFYYISHCDKYIYIATQAKLYGDGKAKCFERDGKLYLEDSIEIWLANEKQVKHQLVFNTAGTLHDSQASTKALSSWNLKDYKVKSVVKNGIWTLETAIPKAELGGKDKWLFNLSRTCYVDPAKPFFTNLVPCRKNIGYSDMTNYAELTLKEKAPVFRMKNLGKLHLGELDLVVETPLTVKVANESATAANFADNVPPQNGTVAIKQKLPMTGKLYISSDVFQNSWNRSQLAPVSIQYIYMDKARKNLLIATKNEGGENGGTLRLSMKNRQTGKVYTKDVKVKGENFFWTETFDMTPLPPGRYEFEGSYIDPSGKKNPPFPQTVIKPEPGPALWANNKIGITPGEVPPPWVPLEVKGNSVKSMVQYYKWENSLFPASMIVNGKELLARSAVLTVNGKAVENAKIKCVKKAADKVVFEAAGSVENLNIKCLISVEFDGMMWVKLSVAGKNVPVKSMTLDIPLKPQYGEQVHSNEIDKHVGSPRFGYTGLVRNNFWSKNLLDRPAFWVGNDDGGICWFAENLVNWSVRNVNYSAQLKVNKQEALIQLNIIDHPVKINGERQIQFGMQMTPVKTHDAAPRTKRLTHDWAWSGVTKYYNMFDTDPEFFNEQSFAFYQKRAATITDSDNRYFLYLGSNGAGPFNPYWAWYGPEWTSRKIGDYIIEYELRNIADRNSRVWTYACLNSRDFCDYMVWSLKNVITAKNIRNLYYDLVGPRMCANTEHGCGWKDENGTTHPTYNVLGAREFHKRMYIFMKKHAPESYHFYHVTGNPAMPAVNSFCTAVVEGESWYNNQVPEKESYFGIVEPREFRVAYSGQKWGYHTIFIPQLARSAYFLKPHRQRLWNSANPPVEMRRAIYHIIGYLYVHDVMPWEGGGGFTTLFAASWKKQNEFFAPWDKSVKFIPYWQQTGKPFTVKVSDPARVLASAYTKGGKAMLVIMNDTNKEQAVEITYQGKKLVDVFKGDKPVEVNGSYKTTINPQVFNLFYFTDK